MQGVNFTTIIIEKYVEKEGKWPSSWEDLKTVSSVNEHSMYSWPEDWQKLQLYVHVDFHADPTILAKQSVEEFDAIKPIGPFYPYKDYGHIASLIETLKKIFGSSPTQSLEGSK
jgi:hypothetical protein